MRLFASLLLALAALSVMASATTYDISFMGSNLASSGSFDYDPVGGFSNFLVTWDLATYDLTALANRPDLERPVAVGLGNTCTGRDSNSAYGFFIMQQMTTGCLLGSPNQVYKWRGSDTGAPNMFEFVQEPGPGAFGDSIYSGFRDGFFNKYQEGDYSIEAVVFAPEPASWVLIGCGLLACSRRRTASPRGGHLDN